MTLTDRAGRSTRCSSRRSVSTSAGTASGAATRRPGSDRRDGPRRCSPRTARRRCGSTGTRRPAGSTVEAWGPAPTGPPRAAPAMTALGKPVDASRRTTIASSPRRPTSAPGSPPAPAATCTTPCCRRSSASGSRPERRFASGRCSRDRLGEPAPGPFPGLLLPPRPERLAGMPTWWFHPLGIEVKRARDARRRRPRRPPALGVGDARRRRGGREARPRSRHRSVDDRHGARSGLRRRRRRARSATTTSRTRSAGTSPASPAATMPGCSSCSSRTAPSAAGCCGCSGWPASAPRRSDPRRRILPMYRW